MFGSPEALKVVKYILTRGQTTQKEIATNTYVSLGYVNEIVQKLREQYIVSKPHARGFVLNDASKLLTILAQEIPMEKRLYARYSLPGSRREVEERIIEDIVKRGSPLQIAFTLLSALPRYSVAAEGEQVSFYARLKHGIGYTGTVEKSIGEEMIGIEAEKNPMGNINVYLTDEWALTDMVSIENVPYVSKVQLIIDLYTYQPLLYIGAKLLDEHVKSLPRKEYMKSEMIDLSKQELHAFVQFFNEKAGNEPVIIGGWAVDHYNPYYGSKDIDVVFEFDRNIWEQLMYGFYHAHGYKRYAKDDLLTVTYRKEVMVGGTKDYIDIDICETTDKNKFHENPDLEIPYALVQEKAYRNRVCPKIGEREIAYAVPIPELLLLYKIKAYMDRDYDLRQTFEANKASYLRSKRDKDGADVIALLQAGVDVKKVKVLVNKYHLTKAVTDTLYAIGSNESSRVLYRRLNTVEIQKKIDSIVNAIR